MPSRRNRPVVPACVALIGAYLLIGCFYVPTGERLIKGDRDVRACIGSEQSKRPIRINISTRDDVLRLLGPPRWSVLDLSRRFAIERPPPLEDDRHLRYHFTTVRGYRVYPLCFAALEQRRLYTVEVQFNDAGIVCGFRVASEDDNISYLWSTTEDRRNHETQPLNKTNTCDSGGVASKPTTR